MKHVSPSHLLSLALVAVASCARADQLAVDVPESSKALAPAPEDALPLAVAKTLPLAPEASAPALENALPAAREIVDRYAEVTHLGEVLVRTSSMHMQGSFAMEAMGLVGAVDVWSAKPDRRFLSMEMGAFGTMVTGYDGKIAWMTHPMMGARILKGTELLQAKLEAAYDTALKASPDYESLQTLGRESFEGKDCYKVEVIAKPLEGMDPEKTRAVRTSIEYYEVASGLLLGNSGRQEGELGGGPFTTNFTDSKDFGGQLLATKTRVRTTGQEIVLTVESVTYDTATETTFALPLEIQKMAAAGNPKPPAADPPKQE